MAARKANRRSTASRSVRPLRKEMTVDGEKYRFVQMDVRPNPGDPMSYVAQILAKHDDVTWEGWVSIGGTPRVRCTVIDSVRERYGDQSVFELPAEVEDYMLDYLRQRQEEYVSTHDNIFRPYFEVVRSVPVPPPEYSRETELYRSEDRSEAVTRARDLWETVSERDRTDGHRIIVYQRYKADGSSSITKTFELPGAFDRAIQNFKDHMDQPDERVTRIAGMLTDYYSVLFPEWVEGFEEDPVKTFSDMIMYGDAEKLIEDLVDEWNYRHEYPQIQDLRQEIIDELNSLPLDSKGRVITGSSSIKRKATPRKKTSPKSKSVPSKTGKPGRDAKGRFVKQDKAPAKTPSKKKRTTAGKTKGAR